MSRTITIRLKSTSHGDRYLVRNAYKCCHNGLESGSWEFGSWETIPSRFHLSAEQESQDQTLWECDVPVDVYETLFVLLLRHFL